MRKFSFVLVTAVIFLVGCSQSPEQKAASEKRVYDRMVEPCNIDPWPMANPGTKDAYKVKDVQKVGDTGIRRVIAERQGDGYLISAFSGHDHEVGSQVELIVVRRMQASNQEYKTTLMVK